MSGGRTVGIIGGNGWLGSSIGRAMLATGMLQPGALCVSSRTGGTPAFADWSGVEVVSDNAVLAARSDVIVLSVRPEQFRAVEIDARGKLVVSVMAGISMRTLGARCGTDRVVRAMPNAAAEIGRSYSPWCASEAVSSDDRTFVRAMFQACGTTDEVPGEAEIDCLTALSGSGPAFPALLARAMLSHALESGLGKAVAERAALAVVADASQLLRADGASPETVVQAFLDYRGTTAAGLRAMIDRDFEAAVHAGLDAARSAAIEMTARYAGPDQDHVSGCGAVDESSSFQHRQ